MIVATSLYDELSTNILKWSLKYFEEIRDSYGGTHLYREKWSKHILYN